MVSGSNSGVSGSNSGEETGANREENSRTRASLLALARQQDQKAWTELVDLYGPLVAHWCRKCGLDRHASADCMQDVFASVARNLERFHPTRETGSFRAWLWTVTSNKIRDRARADARRIDPRGGSTALASLQGVADPISIPEEEPSEDVQINELVTRGLNQIRENFAEKSWAIFNRVVMDGISTAEVAKEFGVSPATVRQTRSRILRKLRSHLGDCE